MSVYSQTLRTEIFDPRVNTAARSEFRLDKGRMFFSNLRLANIGVAQNGGPDIYSKAVGAVGNIRRITLYDGAVELDKCIEPNRYLSWYLCGGPNDSNRYVGQNLLKHQIGYAMADNKVVDGVNPSCVRANDANGGTGHRIVRDNVNDHIKEASAAYLDLRMCLPILESLSIIDTEKMFHNIRLVIEYEPDTVDGRAKVCTIRTDRSKSNLVPILIADELRDESMKSRARSQMKSFTWNTYEHDLVTIDEIPKVTPAADGGGNSIAASVVQKTKRTIDGYKNKFVSRLVMLKANQNKAFNRTLGATDAAGHRVRGLGDYASLAQHKEKINFMVNGRQLISGEGLDSPSKIADIHADAWSNYNILPFSNQENVGLTPVGNLAPYNVYGLCHDQEELEPLGQDPRIGQSSYIGVRIGERMNTLELEYERTAVSEQRAHLNTTGAPLDVHFYAEVPKNFVVSGGDYRIEYA